MDDFRKQGYGTRLLSDFVDYAKGSGMSRVRTTDGNSGLMVKVENSYARVAEEGIKVDTVDHWIDFNLEGKVLEGSKTE